MYPAGLRFTAYVAIFRKDGTVCITHGGVEIGQGIDTRVFIIINHTLLMMMISTTTTTTRFVVCKCSPSSYAINRIVDAYFTSRPFKNPVVDLYGVSDGVRRSSKNMAYPKNEYHSRTYSCPYPNLELPNMPLPLPLWLKV